MVVLKEGKRHLKKGIGAKNKEWMTDNNLLMMDQTRLINTRTRGNTTRSIIKSRKNLREKM